MDRLKNDSKVSYDANIIIYYCFSYKNYRIIGNTTKARKLTQYLVDNGIEIWVPRFIIYEINHKGFPKIVEDYLNTNKNVILNVSKKPSPAFSLRLVQKLQNNFKNLQEKDYFHIEEYIPSDILFESIKSFFINFDDNDKLNEFFNLKNTTELSPSLEDMKLILFSKDKKSTLISNDWDITFFSEELIHKNLAHKIINFKDLSFTN